MGSCFLHLSVFSTRPIFSTFMTWSHIFLCNTQKKSFLASGDRFSGRRRTHLFLGHICFLQHDLHFFLLFHLLPFSTFIRWSHLFCFSTDPLRSTWFGHICFLKHDLFVSALYSVLLVSAADMCFVQHHVYGSTVF